MKAVIKANSYWKLKTDALNDNNTCNKNTRCLVLEKNGSRVALRRSSSDRNGRVIATWIIQLGHTLFGPAYWQCLARWHVQH